MIFRGGAGRRQVCEETCDTGIRCIPKEAIPEPSPQLVTRSVDIARQTADNQIGNALPDDRADGAVRWRGTNVEPVKNAENDQNRPGFQMRLHQCLGPRWGTAVEDHSKEIRGSCRSSDHVRRPTTEPGIEGMASVLWANYPNVMRIHHAGLTVKSPILVFTPTGPNTQTSSPSPRHCSGGYYLNCGVVLVVSETTFLMLEGENRVEDTWVAATGVESFGDMSRAVYQVIAGMNNVS